MEKQCKCGETCGCVSREKYEEALKATAYLANRIKTLDEKYKLALLGSSSPLRGELEEPEPALPGWGGKPYGEENQIKIKMMNDLPPGVNYAKEINLDDKDVVLDDECEACSA
jgi:hypothetical protein